MYGVGWGQLFMLQDIPGCGGSLGVGPGDWGVVRGLSNPVAAVAGLLSRCSPSPPQCPLYLCPPLEALEEGGLPLTLGLEGEHQRSNAALALQLAHCWLEQQDHQGRWARVGKQVGSAWSLPGEVRTHGLTPTDMRELKVSRPSKRWQLPLAPVFHPTSHMRHGKL